MRCDVNVSVRPHGQVALGTKVEVKNMNSFRAMQTAIDFEVTRQSALLREGRGGEIVQETRLFDETRNVRRPWPLAYTHTSCMTVRSRKEAIVRRMSSSAWAQRCVDHF